MNKNVELSVVIVNHNTKRLLEQCLQSIQDTTSDLNLEVFVVDNASSDGSQDMVCSKFPSVKLIANPEAMGFTRAANKALAEGTGNYFLMSHPDIKYLPGTIQTMLSFLESHAEVGIVGANLLYPDNSYNPCPIVKRTARREIADFSESFFGVSRKLPWLHRQLKKTSESFLWDHQNDTESDVVWNACMMIKKDVIEDIGPFCEEFFVWFSDTDLCYRAKAGGWKIYYLKDAKVVHYEKQSGDYIDNRKEVDYKVNWNPAAEAKVDRDRYTLLKRHYGFSYLWLRKAIDTAMLWKRRFATRA